MIVSASGYAELRGKSPAWMTAKIAEGLPVITAGERFTEYQIDSGAAIEWEIDRVKRASEDQPSTERLRRAQADRAEFENRVRRGEFISIELHGETVLALASEVTGQMSGLPGRVAGKITGLQDPAIVRSRLMDECNIVRSAFATHLRGIAGIADGVQSETEGGSELERSTAQDFTGPMGGSEPDIAEGNG